MATSKSTFQYEIFVSENFTANQKTKFHFFKDKQGMRKKFNLKG
jgi:hypothetical protein